MRNRNEKSFDGLSAECSPGTVSHCSRNHQRQFLSGSFENFRNCEQRRLCVKRVKDGLNKQKIDTSFDERFCLVEISLFELIETDGTECGIVYVG